MEIPHPPRFYTSGLTSPGATLYLTAARTFYTFDNPRSVAVKTRYIRQHQLRGAYVWALNHEDAGATVSKAIAAGLE
jgi:chitinase